MPHQPQTHSSDSSEPSNEVELLKKELERATQSRNEFMIGMSHRIRTPLSGVLGMVELLANSALPDSQRLYADTALASGKALMRVFDELLDFCRGEAGELVLSCESFSPAQVANEVIAEFAQEAQEKGVLLTTSCSAEVPESIKGDSKRLRQILYELIENALRFTNEGQVQVGVRPVANHGDLENLLFWVEDTGAGISSEKLMDLFELCLVGDSPAELSIGLPAARQIVGAMGGNIDVESEEGQGTTVRFTVPAKPGWASPAAEYPEHAADGYSRDADRRAARVLVVEDDLVNQRVTLGYLKLVGYEGFVVDSGEGALKALAEDDYDLVLMDKMMPGMDGPAATRAIRAGEGGVRNPGIPIIALTAEVSVQARRECLGSGMNDYLTKPIRRSEIDPVIRAWLPPHLRPKFQKAA